MVMCYLSFFCFFGFDLLILVLVLNKFKGAALDSLELAKLLKQRSLKPVHTDWWEVEVFLPMFLSVKKFLVKNVSRINKTYLIDLLYSHVVYYPTPISLTYAWSFGSLAGISLVIQIISGIFLAMHYTPHIDYAFDSIEFIMRDVEYGWFVRYLHSNGASMFFIVVYCHMGRGLYYGSYLRPRQWVWISGVCLFFLMMGAAFTGYVLPWGQMSLWGATVITSMVTIIPVQGRRVAEWLWGGYVIKNPTLRRFFIIHMVIPFLIVGVTFIHLALLHKVGSNTPIGSDSHIDDVPFYPYFVTKDMFALSLYSLVFVYFFCFAPNYLSHPDNYVNADPMETPRHVLPEWYFLPFFLILRAIPHKVLGILAMFGSIFVLFFLPFIDSSQVRNTTFRPIFKFCFWWFLVVFFVMFWTAAQPKRPWTDVIDYLGWILTPCYFIFFIFFLPLSGKIETYLLDYGKE